MRMNAKMRSRCSKCDGQIEVGDRILYLPPKGRRRFGIVAHDACAKAYGAEQKAAHDEAASRSSWLAENHTQSWTTPEQFQMVREAMAKMKR